MATRRERPYSQFNYLVNLGASDPASVEAGFQEVTGLGIEITVAEYRNGNEATNATRKITAGYKATDVTLKRGLIGTDDLYTWVNQVRSGAQDALRNVRIQLRSEDRQTIAVTWTLRNARPTKYTGPSLNAKGTDVAIEELVLACEDIEIA